MQRTASTAGAGRGVGVRTAGTTAMGEGDSLVVHVQLRPRRGATRKCLAALAAMAAEHESVAFAVTGLSKDDRVVKVTVGIDLGPRNAVAKFSPQAQAAYAFVSAVFTTLYDHMPVYVAEPSVEERMAAASLLTAVAGPAVALAPEGEAAGMAAGAPAGPGIPSQRLPEGAGRVPA